MKPLVIGIDPGTGVNSGAGVAVIDVEKNQLLMAKSVWGSRRGRVATHLRIREISRLISSDLASFFESAQTLFVESFVMRGKGGETLARFTGAIIGIIPDGVGFEEVQNTRVKKLVGGRGDSDKLAVAEAVYDHFEGSPESIEIIEELVVAEDYDAIDAIAIALAGVKYNGTN